MTTKPAAAAAHRFTADPEAVERDLARLALTVVELLRQLMERQAVHRMEHGDLTADEEERIGTTLRLLDERMTYVVGRFGLTRSDLNLDLGPLGTLLAPD